MKVIIAGTRKIEYPANLRFVEEAVELSGWKNEITEIVSGCARGIDEGGILFAQKNPQYILTKIPADWNNQGVKAGILRNISMAKYADALIAIWDGWSPGTQHMIAEAKSRGLKLFLHSCTTSHNPHSILPPGFF